MVVVDSELVIIVCLQVLDMILQLPCHLFLILHSLLELGKLPLQRSQSRGLFILCFRFVFFFSRNSCICREGRMSASEGRENNNRKKKDLPLPADLVAALGGLGGAVFLDLVVPPPIFQVSTQKDKFQTSAEALIPLNGRT